jgi:putative ABC transport system permease protein
MRFVTFVLKNIGRRRVRSALTVVGIAVAVGAMVAFVGLAETMIRSFANVYHSQNIDIVVQQKGAKQRLTSSLDQRLSERIVAIPGVKAVYRGSVDMMGMEEAGPMGVLVQGWEADSALFDSVRVVRGRQLAQGDDKRLMVGIALADSLEKKVGEKVTVFEDEQFEIAGIYQAGDVFQNGGIIMLLSDLQHFMSTQGRVSGFTVCVHDRDNKAGVERICKAIEGIAKNLSATATGEFVKQTPEMQVISAIAWLVCAVAIVICTILVLNTMIMSVFERTKEIGILRAIGWRRSRVVRMIVMEAGLFSLAGGILGSIGGVVLVRLLSKTPWVAGLVDANVPTSVIFEGFAFAVVIGLLGAAYPAYRGAQLLPTEAIRHE